MLKCFLQKLLVTKTFEKVEKSREANWRYVLQWFILLVFNVLFHLHLDSSQHIVEGNLAVVGEAFWSLLAELPMYFKGHLFAFEKGPIFR